MTMKPPTIDDIYMADAYLATPGVRQGLLERAADGNDDEVVTEDTDDGQVVYYRTPYGEMVPVGRPIMLAASPSGTMSDAGSGMPSIKPTPRNPVMGGIADFVRSVRDLANQYEIKDFVPLLGGMGVGDLLMGKSPEELENWAYGNSPITMPPRGTGGLVPVVKTGRKEGLADTAFLGLDATGLAKAGGAAGRGVARAAGQAINQAMIEGTGPAARIIPQAVRPMNVVPPSPATAAAAPVSDIGFYSAVEQAAMKTPRKSGSGQAFLNDILKGENVKADEVKWIGLDDFLKGKKNVTRDEVQQFIASNRVDVQEVTLGGPKPFDEDRLAKLEAEYRALKQHPLDDPSFGEEKYDELIRLMNIRDQSTVDSLYAAAEQATISGQRAQSQGARITAEKYFREAEFLNTRAEKLDLQGQGMSDPPRYGQYTLPGGKNYREILLTLPDNFGAKPNKNGYTPLSAIGDAQFRSSHWDQPNVLAHIRVNDRVDADGKKMLLVEEVQSDWHQAGRDKGYKSDVNPEENKALVKQWDTLANERRDLERIVAVGDDADPAVQSAVQRLGEISNELNAVNDRLTQVRTTFREGVPDAPMKDTWYQLALKRVLKYAADNGYERVGLTTGARQAERYDLSKQVDEITVPMVIQDGSRSVRIDPVKGSSIKLMVDADGTVTGFGAGSVQFSGKKLNEVIGKEMAEKVMAAAPDTKFSGLDLRVGGEGMKKYYDEVYPQFLAKYGKKWDAKMGETKINLQGDLEGFMPRKDMQVEPVRYIDITPQMRESVSKGQPLFTAVPAGTAAAGATMQDKEQK